GVASGEAAVHAARTRLRPILMTSLSFILGVAPLAVATGAGAEMRQSLGTAVLFGMLGVTCFGLLFTPAFYTFIRKLGHKEYGGALPEASEYPPEGGPVMPYLPLDLPAREKFTPSERSISAWKQFFRRRCRRRRSPSPPATARSWVYRRARCAMRNRL